jgi:hypothetical protein
MINTLIDVLCSMQFQHRAYCTCTVHTFLCYGRLLNYRSDFLSMHILLIAQLIDAPSNTFLLSLSLLHPYLHLLLPNNSSSLSPHFSFHPLRFKHPHPLPSFPFFLLLTSALFLLILLLTFFSLSHSFPYTFSLSSHFPSTSSSFSPHRPSYFLLLLTLTLPPFRLIFLPLRNPTPLLLTSSSFTPVHYAQLLLMLIPFTSFPF